MLEGSIHADEWFPPASGSCTLANVSFVQPRTIQCRMCSIEILTRWSRLSSYEVSGFSRIPAAKAREAHVSQGHSWVKQILEYLQRHGNSLRSGVSQKRTLKIKAGRW
jgi:hypothetical protein